MMKRFFKFFTYVVIFFIFFIIFLPKESFYNLFEKELEKKQIIISNEIRQEKLFSLDISNSDIYYQGINVSKIDSFSFKTYFFNTKIDVNNVNFLDSLSTFIPTPINKIVLTHSILNPNKISVESNGAFGELKAEINILTRLIKIELNASSIMKNSYSKLLKNMRYENERYFYEYKF